MDTNSIRATGNALKALRVEAGLTQMQVASRLGKPQSYVSKIESGERSLRVYELFPLARAYGLSPHDAIDALERALSEQLNGNAPDELPG